MVNTNGKPTVVERMQIARIKARQENLIARLEACEAAFTAEETQKCYELTTAMESETNTIHTIIAFLDEVETIISAIEARMKAGNEVKAAIVTETVTETTQESTAMIVVNTSNENTYNNSDGAKVYDTPAPEKKARKMNIHMPKFSFDKDKIKARVSETAVQTVGIANECYKTPFQAAQMGVNIAVKTVAVAGVLTNGVLHAAEIAPETVVKMAQCAKQNYNDTKATRTVSA